MYQRPANAKSKKAQAIANKTGPDVAQHKSVKCDDCHHATQSRLTSDVLMPGISDCVACHSPKGKVVAECITCHSYHAPASLTVAEMRPGDEFPGKKAVTARRP